MKKNLKKISILALGLVAGLCFVGTTIAKYTTDNSATDTARVAKWGVEITANDMDTNPLFKGEYNIEEGDTGLSLAVKSSNTEKLLAPGTNGSITALTVSGTPEVAVNVTRSATLTLSNWEIGSDEYCPIVFTIEQNNETSTFQMGDVTNEAEGVYATIAELKSAFEKEISDASAKYEPNSNLAEKVGSIVISWDWAFQETQDSFQKDALDTELGDLSTAPSVTVLVSIDVTQIN